MRRMGRSYKEVFFVTRKLHDTLGVKKLPFTSALGKLGYTTHVYVKVVVPMCIFLGCLSASQDSKISGKFYWWWKFSTAWLAKKVRATKKPFHLGHLVLQSSLVLHSALYSVQLNHSNSLGAPTTIFGKFFHDWDINYTNQKKLIAVHFSLGCLSSWNWLSIFLEK